MKSISFSLPATSANLGPGFDTVGLALELFLHVQATPADAWSIQASGRDCDLISRLNGNLLIETCRKLAPNAPALALTLVNEIPLGMGCGSSAAALLAGVLLANHFGELGLSRQQILEHACRLEGHPDNVAACLLGGFTVSSLDPAGGQVVAATFAESHGWQALLALPSVSLATVKARALLPETYSRADAVLNVSSTALLVAAFALGRPELLAAGTRDRLHQPWRAEVCPLLGRLLPLVGTQGIYSVTLSGAGPSVLLLCAPAASPAELEARHDLIWNRGGDQLLEIVTTRVHSGNAGNHEQSY